MSKEKLQRQITELVEKAGSDQAASELLWPYCQGHAPDRSLIGKMRRGQATLTTTSLTIALLSQVLQRQGK